MEGLNTESSSASVFDIRRSRKSPYQIHTHIHHCFQLPPPLNISPNCHQFFFRNSAFWAEFSACHGVHNVYDVRMLGLLVVFTPLTPSQVCLFVSPHKKCAPSWNILGHCRRVCVHLEAAVCYTSQIHDSVFRHVATVADFSAAMLYQNDVAMAQSPLPIAELTTQKNYCTRPQSVLHTRTTIGKTWLHNIIYQMPAPPKYLRGSPNFCTQQYGI